MAESPSLNSCAAKAGNVSARVPAAIETRTNILNTNILQEYLQQRDTSSQAEFPGLSSPLRSRNAAWPDLANRRLVSGAKHRKTLLCSQRSCESTWFPSSFILLSCNFPEPVERRRPGYFSPGQSSGVSSRLSSILVTGSNPAN